MASKLLSAYDTLQKNVQTQLDLVSDQKDLIEKLNNDSKYVAWKDILATLVAKHGQYLPNASDRDKRKGLWSAKYQGGNLGRS